MKAIAAKTKSRPGRRFLWIAGIAVVVLAGGLASWRRIRAAVPHGGPVAGGAGHGGIGRAPRRADLPPGPGNRGGVEYRRHPQPSGRQAAVRQFHRGPGGPRRRHPRGHRSAHVSRRARSGGGEKGGGSGPAGCGPQGSRALQDAGPQECRDPAERRHPAGQGRSTGGDDRRRPGRDRQRPDPALLCHHHGADRWPRRLPAGRCRQHHPCQRSQSAHGADADSAGSGDLHAAAKKSRRGAGRHAARPGGGRRLRSGQQA